MLVRGVTIFLTWLLPKIIPGVADKFWQYILSLHHHDVAE
jgi:hypothetical protein